MDSYGRQQEKEMREPLLRKESAAAVSHVHSTIAVHDLSASVANAPSTAAAAAVPHDQSELSDLEFLQQYVNVQRGALPADTGRDEIFDMTAALQRCQNTVVLPITWLLRLLAWTHLDVSSYPRLSSALNIFYPLAILTLIFYSYAYDIIVCLDGREDGTSVCSNIISKYIVPDIVHFISFAYAMYYFRRLSGFEHLTSLIETVFLRSTENSYQTLYGDLSHVLCVDT
eukprot:Opistho-2@53875